jgi:hypothetical protein
VHNAAEYSTVQYGTLHQTSAHRAAGVCVTSFEQLCSGEIRSILASCGSRGSSVILWPVEGMDGERCEVDMVRLDVR